MMRIAIIAPKARNCGVGQYSLTLLQNLLKIGPNINMQIHFSIIPLMTGPLINVPGILFCIFSGRYRLLHFQYHSGLFSPSSLSIINRLVFRVNFILAYGLVVARSYLAHFLSTPKICVTIHGISIPLHSLLKKWYNKFDYIIVHSEIMREKLIENGVSAVKARVIPHGIPKFHDAQNESMFKKKAEKEIKIILFGFVHENKGHHIAIAALSFLPKNYKLIICGKPRLRSHEPYFYKLKEIALELGVQNRIKFLGFIPDNRLYEVLSKGDCFVFPYLWSDSHLEWSGALAAAVACNLPIIASDIPIFREVYDKYGCIKLFKRGDPHSLAIAIRQVMEDKQLRMVLQHGTLILEEETSWENVANLTLNTYLELIVDHPDWIYEDESQKLRLAWLKNECLGSIIEVGCATGYVTAYVGASAGVDIRRDRLMLAKRKFQHICFILSDAMNLPIKDQSYDTVILPEILEHLEFEHAKKTLKEALRVSRQLVLVTLPRAEYFDYTHDANTGRLNPEHLWDPTENRLKTLIEGLAYDLQTSVKGKFWFVKISKGNN